METSLQQTDVFRKPVWCVCVTYFVSERCSGVEAEHFCIPVTVETASEPEFKLHRRLKLSRQSDWRSSCRWVWSSLKQSEAGFITKLLNKFKATLQTSDILINSIMHIVWNLIKKLHSDEDGPIYWLGLAVVREEAASDRRCSTLAASQLLFNEGTNWLIVLV